MNRSQVSRRHLLTEHESACRCNNNSESSHPALGYLTALKHRQLQHSFLNSHGGFALLLVDDFWRLEQSMEFHRSR